MHSVEKIRVKEFLPFYRGRGLELFIEGLSIQTVRNLKYNSGSSDINKNN